MHLMIIIFKTWNFECLRIEFSKLASTSKLFREARKHCSFTIFHYFSMLVPYKNTAIVLFPSFSCNEMKTHVRCFECYFLLDSWGKVLTPFHYKWWRKRFEELYPICMVSLSLIELLELPQELFSVWGASTRRPTQ